ILWFPERVQPAVSMMSGTLGGDRVFPAHYRVHVYPASIAVSKVDKTYDASGVTFPERINDGFLVRLPHPDDDGFLQEGMKVSIVGYQELGDEGETWTAFDSIEILSQASAADFGSKQASVSEQTSILKQIWVSRLRQLFQ
ncbi:MAG: hypothetical protein AAFN08_09940, partial [Cyanobacteria bacterium J06559_3]